VLKPSEKDPSASLLIAAWLAEAGLPDGAFNVVHGDREAVEALLRHPGIASVSFVGSTPVAKSIYEIATSSGKRVQALGGAKNHAVVMPDADVEIAADAIASAAYGSAGQRCMAISAAVAVGPAGDALAAALESRAEAIRVGPGSEDGSEMGPLVTGAARDRVLSAIETGIGEGAELRRDGRGLEVADHEDGFWVGPTLFDRVTPEMSIYREEIFGPVLIMLRAETFEEALELVNSNPYGNGSAIFTADGRTAREFEQRVQTGMVGVNVPIPVPMAYYSFGGWKQSLFGDLHVHGREGVLFYTRGKVVTERWPEQAHGAEYGFPAHK
jgi:malonate-semialdehyde dehydrogenase (acetylating) / methylmalonate-semialdehyde dehydrogenase